MTLKNARVNSQTPIIFILPVAFYFLIVVIYPLVLLISFSFKEKRIGEEGTFIGLANFLDLLKEETVYTIIFNTFRYAIFSACIALAIGLILAIIFYSLKTSRYLYQVLIILPWCIPPAVIALIWLWMFYDVGGIINWFFSKLGIMPVSWLGIKDLARFSVLFPNIWRLVPFFTLCLLAARANLPPTPYNAAKLDGANLFGQFIYITLPGLRRAIVVTFLFGFLWSCAEFPLIYILTRGGPGVSTHILGTFSYEIALRGGFEVGLGAAVAVFLIPLAVIAGMVVWKIGLWSKV